MFIKKFLADNVMDAMNMVKSELGDEAIILHTKKIKKNSILKFWKKEKIEVLAALDNNKSDKEKLIPKNEDLTITGEQRKFEFPDLGEFEYKQNDIPKTLDIEKEAEYIPKNHYDSIKSEVTGIKQLVSELKTSIEEGTIAQNNGAFSGATEIEDEILADSRIQNIIKKGMPKDMLKRFVQAKGFKIDEDVDLNAELKNFISEELSSIEYDDSDLGDKFNIFIGPTGVGKTTTLAKMASRVVINQGKNVGFLTLDTYRVAAVEQLKVYSEILKMPMHVAYNSHSLKSSIENVDPEDVVFVDTAGRSHKNKMHMKELERLLNEFQDKNIFLVLSANVNIEDMENIIKEFDYIDRFNIIVTKLDETDRPLSILGIMSKLKLPIAYITFGQSVPDDIKKFDINEFLEEALRGN